MSNLGRTSLIHGISVRVDNDSIDEIGIREEGVLPKLDLLQLH